MVSLCKLQLNNTFGYYHTVIISFFYYGNGEFTFMKLNYHRVTKEKGEITC